MNQARQHKDKEEDNNRNKRLYQHS